MKGFKLIITLCITLSIISCQKEENYQGKVLGTWTFGSVFIDGVGSTAFGTINFQEENQSSMNVIYLIETDTIFMQGPFVFTESAENVEIIFDNNTILFKRKVNKNNEQEFEFKVNHNQLEHSVVFDMVPE
jgi:hypothetical protein